MRGTVIGIDPGLSGAIVANACGPLYCWDMPTLDVTVNGKRRRRIDVRQLAAILTEIGQCEMAVLEEYAIRPSESGTSAVQIGRGWGEIHAALVVLDRPLTTVKSAAWTKALGVGKEKDEHRRRAMELHPNDAHLFMRKMDDGRADAALMAHWWMRLR